MKTVKYFLITAAVFSFIYFVRAVALSDSNSSSSYNSEMVLIPGGNFIFGLDDAQRNLIKTKYGEETVKTYFLRKKVVMLKPYYIDKNEVTNRQFLLFLDNTKYKMASSFNRKYAYSNPTLPVTNVGWAAARAYAKWVGKRLPTEEEWEKAARGPNGNLWPWGNKDNGRNYNGVNQGNYKPVSVGFFARGQSMYGVNDLAGNVYEMTTGKWKGSNCMRGGSFLNKGAFVSGAFRWAPEDTINGAEWLGFRCVKDLQ